MNHILQMRGVRQTYAGFGSIGFGDTNDLDTAAAAVIQGYNGAAPDCSNNSAVSGFQSWWNQSHLNALRIDGVYDAATQAALTQALASSTTGPYASGTKPTAPAPATCAAATTTTTDTASSSSSGSTALTSSSTSSGMSTTTIAIAAVGVVAVGGVAWWLLAPK